ncbi:hypothetical protein ACRALDRAFT_1061358 [Sodiomyces alcalophilus JCM 7366]|uniref:uncharacterized protein n=1 Tax=Sodiomyces alcalophilus JCM 7366 TaxID=591952 RepID=UPI0039B561C9
MPQSSGKSLQQEKKLAVPSLAEGSSSGGDITPRASGRPDTDTNHEVSREKRRSLFGFGKKKEESATSIIAGTPSTTTNSNPAAASATTTSPTPVASIAAPQDDASNMPPRPALTTTTSKPTTSPALSDQPIIHPSSPSRGYSGSPRLSSPAGSQIFERDVDTVSLKPQSPAIPSHIQAENHIPAVLDASSEAITDDHLDPDSVEIVTLAQHMSAAASVAGGHTNGSVSYDPMAASWTEELGPLADREQDNVSTYGSVDNADVRRLSFISFADVVQAEQAEQANSPGASRESMHIPGLTSFSMNRSPSPIRSPVSSQGGPGTSPPTSHPGSIKGLELSPGRKPMGGTGSPISSYHINNGELNIETMTQALRRTGSKDFNNLRSLPISPIEGPAR